MTKKEMMKIIESSEKASQLYQAKRQALNYQAIIATIIVVAILSLLIFSR